MSDKTFVMYAASYDSQQDALHDLKALKEIKSSGEIRDLTAAVVSKNDKGKLHVHETTHAGKVAAGLGVVAGAIIGAVFPPAGIAVISAAVGGAAGVGVVAGAIGHFASGISRKDMKELGEYLDAGEAALLAVAVDAVGSAVADLEKGLDKAANIAGSCARCSHGSAPWLLVGLIRTGGLLVQNSQQFRKVRICP